MKNLTLRRHHIHNLYQYLVEELSLEKLIKEGYSASDFMNISRYFNEIVNNPNTVVKIVGGLDGICEKCSVATADCNILDGDYVSAAPLSTRAEDVLGIRIGERYKACELIQKLKEFAKIDILKEAKHFLNEYSQSRPPNNEDFREYLSRRGFKVK